MYDQSFEQSYQPIYWEPPKSSYVKGEKITRNMFAPDGALIGKTTFTIQCSPGSGFAGQVYQANPEPSSRLPDRVAIKVLHPRSTQKTWLRDVLFWICFQSTFTPRLREEDVRTGLTWQILIKAAVESEMGAPDAISMAYGYFWDPDLASFAEVHEWVDGRPARNEPDEFLLSRILGQPCIYSEQEMKRKKVFMDHLACLCRKLGASGLARQYDWWTLVSQDNVLTRVQATQSPETFCAVDCRPGLAIPFFAPVTPGHANIILDGLRRGKLVHYAETDLHRLDKYFIEHPGLAIPTTMIDRVKKDEFTMLNNRLCIWHTQSRFFLDAKFRHNTCSALAQDLHLTRQVSADTARLLSKSSVLIFLTTMISLLPIIGPFLIRFLGNKDYRKHLHEFIFHKQYRQHVIIIWQKLDPIRWVSDERISDTHAASLRNKIPLFLFEKYCLSWLPAGLHRMLTDYHTVVDILSSLLLSPLKLLFSQKARCIWLEEILTAQYKSGIIPLERLQIYKMQINEPRLQGYIKDLGFLTALDLFSRLVYLILGLYGFQTGNFLFLGLAALSPIPPSGPIRSLYIIIQLIFDLFRAKRWSQPATRMIEARIAGLLFSPWRWVGNLFPLVEISTFYTRLSFLLAEYFIAQAAERVPIFGGRGKLLEYAIFQICYNIPLSIRYEIIGRKRQAKTPN